MKGNISLSSNSENGCVFRFDFRAKEIAKKTNEKYDLETKFLNEIPSAI